MSLCVGREREGGGLYCGSVRVRYRRTLTFQQLYRTTLISLYNRYCLFHCRNCENKIPDVLLIGRQSCIIPQDCQVSTWSQLKPFNSSCVGPDGAVVPGFMIRTRQVLQLPMGNGLACPPNLVDMVPLSEKEDPATLKPCRR